MASETIVAVFDSAGDAEAAMAELHSAGIADSAIQHYSKSGLTAGDGAAGTARSESYAGSGTTGRPAGFWAWLLGEEGTDQQAALYDRSIESGGTVVTVIADSADNERVVAILEKHAPVDLDERGARYGLGGTAATATQAGTRATATGTGLGATGPTGATGDASPAGAGSTEQVIPLAEERLEVGKRQVDRGSTRLRRYVVERPVEEQIRLRNETVSVVRRPASGAGTVGEDAFTDRTIELHETAEEAVVSKRARVVEEVVVRKGVEERVETVRDTVRREEVEVEGDRDRLPMAAGPKPAGPTVDPTKQR